ncbi:hypothetical protein I4U23_011394 [Adineta vaga]|nr:hypothetical protein I4U23_011394 [Adineta vaga]
MDFECKVISSTQTFSQAWWEDIVNAHLYQHVQVCVPAPLNSTAFFSNDNQISINVIGYVGVAPSSFDLILDPLIHLRSSLKSISVVNGKTPAQIMLLDTFRNCSGKLRYFDKQKFFIDTPATYGFSGGICFVPSSSNEWEFIGILLGTTKLWNYCISLTTTSTYKSCQNLFRNKQEL